jgi:hypothetical protein
MKLRFTIAFFTVLLLLSVSVQALHKLIRFDKNEYYTAVASQNIDNVNDELKIVQASSFAEKDAYEGTLLMTKAGLAKKVTDKISFFRSGHSKLEACIRKYNENAELHFLRLMIQENAPAIVGYKGDLEKDKAFILKSFKTLSPEVQKYILDYSKKSKILNPKDF